VKDELIATELIFENALTELPAEEIIALFSALVFELKTDVEVKLGGTLEEVRPQNTIRATRTTRTTHNTQHNTRGTTHDTHGVAHLVCVGA
jgi:superfamily II RNA helicase